MIYKRDLWTVAAECHKGPLGLHVFAVAVAALLASASLCLVSLSASTDGYFSATAAHSPRLVGLPYSTMTADYDMHFGLFGSCSEVVVQYREKVEEDKEREPTLKLGDPAPEDAPLITVEESGCFGLGETVYMDALPTVVLHPGGSMAANVGYVAGAGLATIAVWTLGFAIILLLLRCDVPVLPPGFPYMRSLGILSGVSALYLVLTVLISYFFAVLSVFTAREASSVTVPVPEWSYILCSTNVILLTLLSIAACQAVNIDADVTLQQFTSSNDGVKQSLERIRKHLVRVRNSAELASSTSPDSVRSSVPHLDESAMCAAELSPARIEGADGAEVHVAATNGGVSTGQSTVDRSEYLPAPFR